MSPTTLAAIGPNDLAIFPTLGLVLFFGVFVAVSWRAIRRPRAEITRWAGMPFDDDAPTAPAGAPAERVSESLEEGSAG